MIRHYFITALRHLWKYKVQNLIGIAGLSVGLFCFSVTFYTTRFMNSLDECYENNDRLVDVAFGSDEDEEIPGEVSVHLTRILREQNLPEIKAVTTTVNAMEERRYIVSTKGEKKELYTFSSMEVDSFYNTLFTPRLLYGTWEAAARTENSLVISLSVAHRIFGENVNPVGQQMRLYKREALELHTVSDSLLPAQDYTIQAVMEDLPENASINLFQKLDMLVLNEAAGLLRNPQKKTKFLIASTEVLLKPGYHIEDLKRRLEGKTLPHPSVKEEWLLKYTPMGIERIDKDLMPFFTAIWVIGALILFAGLLNFLSFQFGLFQNRMKEYSVRKMAGGERKHLFGLLFTQLFLVTSFAALLLFAIIELSAPLLYLSFLNLYLEIEPAVLMKHAFQYLFLLWVLEALLCLYLVWKMQRMSLRKGLSGGRFLHGGYLKRNLMLGVQFFICFLFVAATAALYLQSEKTGETMYAGLTKEEKKAIFRLSVMTENPFLNEAQKQEILNRIRACREVKEITSMGGDADFITLNPDGSQPYTEVGILHVESNFFSFFGLPLVAGSEMKDRSQMVIDERAQKKWNLLGKTAYLDGKEPYTICGVSTPLTWNVYAEPWPQLFVLRKDTKPVDSFIKAYPGKEKEVKEYIEQLQNEFSSSPLFVRSLYDELYKQQAIENGLRNGILCLSITSLIITLLGAYSAVTLDTERRQKEIAIRKVNGAKMKDIIRIFAKLYLILIVVSALLALPLFWMVLELWKQMYTVFFKYGWLYWTSIVLIVFVITCLTVLFKILRIARIDPAKVIRNE